MLEHSLTFDINLGNRFPFVVVERSKGADASFSSCGGIPVYLAVYIYISICRQQEQVL